MIVSIHWNTENGREKERKGFLAAAKGDGPPPPPFLFWPATVVAAIEKTEKKKNCSPPLFLGLASGSKVRHEVRLCQGLCRDGRRGRRARSREVESSSFVPRRQRRRRQTTTVLKQRRGRERSSRSSPSPFAPPRRRQEGGVGAAPPAGRSERVHRSQRHFFLKAVLSFLFVPSLDFLRQ